MKISQKGFTVIEGLLIVLIISMVGFAGYYVWNQNQKKDDKKSTPASSAAVSTKPSAAKTVSPPDGWIEYTEEPLAFFYPATWSIRDESGSERIASDPTWDLHITFRAKDEPDILSSQLSLIVRSTTSTNEEQLAAYGKEARYSGVIAVEANGLKGAYGEVNYEGTSRFVDFVYKGKEYKFSSSVLSKDKLFEVTNTLRIK